MKRLIPILVFLFAFTAGFGQNWNPLNPGVKRYYLNNNNYLKGIRVDSVIAYGNDLYYHTFKTYRGSANAGLGFGGDTMTYFPGFRNIRKQDGSFFFFNKWNDTLVIKTLAAVGDSWWFHRDDSGLSYLAEVTSADVVPVLGSNDSIKRILLTAYNNGVAAPDDTFNNTEIIISKNHGFHTMVDMALFPYRAPGDTELVDDFYFFAAIWPDNYYGLGMTPAGTLKENCLFRITGYPTFSPAEMNDMSVGDISEYRGCTVASGSPYGCGQYWYYELDTITAKAVVGDSVRYERKGWRAQVNQFGYYDMVARTDTLYYSMISESPQVMPEEYSSNFGVYASPSYYFAGDTSHCYVGDAFYTHAWTMGLPGSFFYSLTKVGVGVVHSIGGSVPSDVSERSLIYFVRNGVPCGTFILPDTAMPVSVVNINEPSLHIYPNPAMEQLTVEVGMAGHSLLLVNAVGQTVYRKEACKEKEQIDTRHFASGVYYLRVEQEGKALYNRKIIIRN